MGKGGEGREREIERKKERESEGVEGELGKGGRDRERKELTTKEEMKTSPLALWEGMMLGDPACKILSLSFELNPAPRLSHSFPSLHFHFHPLPFPASTQMPLLFSSMTLSLPLPCLTLLFPLFPRLPASSVNHRYLSPVPLLPSSVPFSAPL